MGKRSRELGDERFDRRKTYSAIASLFEKLTFMYRALFKRCIDFFVLIVLLAIWPMLFIIAIWLHFANKGTGAFFLQERPGKGRKIFKVIKFKSMTDRRDAEENCCRINNV